MKFGFFMMPSHPHTENPTLAFEQDLELIEYAESLGLDEVWVGEHHSGGWETIPAPDIFLAAAATRTKRIRLGTAVINLPYHHPFHVAERIAFLDHLAYGRIMLGCGPGVLAPDVKLFGINPTELRPMMNESLDIILQLYRTDEPVSYQGQYWQIENMALQVRSFQQPHVPIFLVSSGSGNSIRVAAERGLPVISGAFTIPGVMDLNQQWQLYEQEANNAGHTVSRDDWRLGNVPVYVAESMEQAKADVAEGAMREAREYFFHSGLKTTYEAYPGQPASEITFDQVAAQRGWIIGDPDHCVQRIRELQDATGGFGGLLMLSIDWTSKEKWYRSLELFSRYVMPQFKGTLTGIQSSYQRMVEDNRQGILPRSRSGFVQTQEQPHVSQ